MTFEKGQLVIPISKSVGRDLQKSLNWLQKVAPNQPFFYVVGFSEGDIICNPRRTPNSGDRFLPTDLILYAKNLENRQFVHLLKENK